MTPLALFRSLWVRRADTRTRRPHTTFARPCLELLEERLPPGDMLWSALFTPLGGALSGSPDDLATPPPHGTVAPPADLSNV